MGGRGSSSATNGVSSSLKNFSKATEQFNPASVQQPTIQEVLKGNITPKGGVAYSDFKKMSDDEKKELENLLKDNSKNKDIDKNKKD